MGHRPRPTFSVEPSLLSLLSLRLKPRGIIPPEVQDPQMSFPGEHGQKRYLALFSQSQGQPRDYFDLPVGLALAALSPLLAPSADLPEDVSVEDLPAESEAPPESPDDLSPPDGLSFAAALR